MKGDFSRWTFDPVKAYSRVLSLQGRVFLDADFNEAQEILLAHIRTLTANLLGHHAGVEDSFKISNPTATDFQVQWGSYYVAGIRCDNFLNAGIPANQAMNAVKYSELPALFKPEDLAKQTAPFLVYLDVWERFVTYIEDEDRTPAELHQTIREVALGGPDTAARSQVVWQIRFLQNAPVPPNDRKQYWPAFVKQLQAGNVDRIPGSDGRIKIRARKPNGADEPCPTNPDDRYRGPENQLYRVEIHTGGILPPNDNSPATYKWSRENGSVIFPISSIEGSIVTLETLGHDERLGLKIGSLVEVVDDTSVLLNTPQDLMTIKSLDPETFVVELSANPSIGSDPKAHPILRRWEGSGNVAVNPDRTDGYWPLEQGIEVFFGPGEYRSGDYWMSPARTATGDVEWPGPATDPQLQQRHGPFHFFAPLAYIAAGGGPTDVRLVISPPVS